jgi:hypothetical protein
MQNNLNERGVLDSVGSEYKFSNLPRENSLEDNGIQCDVHQFPLSAIQNGQRDIDRCGTNNLLLEMDIQEDDKLKNYKNLNASQGNILGKNKSHRIYFFIRKKYLHIYFLKIGNISHNLFILITY